MMTDLAFDHAKYEDLHQERHREILQCARLEYLEDNKGIYGLSIPIVYYPTQTMPAVKDVSYIVRPDRLADTSEDKLVLQALPWRVRPSFIEQQLITGLTDAMLARAGLVRPWPTPWWSHDEEVRQKNRRHYHALKAKAHRIANCMIRSVLLTADQNALRVARRYPFSLRSGIYRAAASSPRARQLAQTFPILAATLYCGQEHCGARDLVESGAPLKLIAEIFELPMALRKVKPGSVIDARRCIGIFRNKPDLIHTYMPESLPAQRRWLKAIDHIRALGPPFVEWVARNADDLPGRAATQIIGQIDNIGDWVRASYESIIQEAIEGIPRHVVEACGPRLISIGNASNSDTCRLITRRFSPDMTLRTVFALSDEWHEAVANLKSDSAAPFPEPWVAAAAIDGYDIKPIANAADLYREGKRMRHCVASFGTRVHWGECQIYHMSKGGDPIATTEVRRNGQRPSLGQVRGPLNSMVDKAIMRILQKWLRRAKDLPPLTTSTEGVCLGEDAEQIPF